MSKTRVTVNIHSRMYNVVAEEKKEYIEALAEHINSKVDKVMQSGQNTMGERPIVLAALNVCDEYFKSIQSGNDLAEQLKLCAARLKEEKGNNKELKNELTKLAQEAAAMKKELEEIKQNPDSQIVEYEKIIQEQKDMIDKLTENEKQLKHNMKQRDNTIKYLEQKVKKQKEEFEESEREILKLIENS